MLGLRVQFNLIIPSLRRDIPGTRQPGPAGGLQLWGHSAALLSSRNGPAPGLLPLFPAGSRPPLPPLSSSPFLGFLTLPRTDAPPPPRAGRPSGAAALPTTAKRGGDPPPPRSCCRVPPDLPPPSPGRCLRGRRWPPPPRWVRAPTQPHGPSLRHPPGGERRRHGAGAAEPRWDKSPRAGASPPEPGQGWEGGGGQRFPPSPLGERARGSPSLGRTPGSPAAPSDLLRAAKSSSPAAERGEPRASPVRRSSGSCCCRYRYHRRRSASLRFPTDGLAGRRLTPRSSRALSLSPAGGFSPRFLYWRQGT